MAYFMFFYETDDRQFDDREYSDDEDTAGTVQVWKESVSFHLWRPELGLGWEPNQAGEPPWRLLDSFEVQRGYYVAGWVEGSWSVF